MALAGQRSRGTERPRLSMEDHEAQLLSNVYNSVDGLNQLWDQVEGGAVVTDLAKERLRLCREQLTGVWNSWKQLAEFEFLQQSQRLKHAYDKCWVPNAARLPLGLDDITMSDIVLRTSTLSETTLALEQRYARATAVFDKFAEWHTVWQEKITADTVPLDYKSRDLQARIKRATYLSTLVPRAMKKLSAAVQQYLKEHPEDGEAVILVGGKRADHHAQHLEVQYEVQNKERLAQKKLGVEQKFRQPDDADRSLHNIRRTPMKRARRATAFNLDQSVSTPLRNKATRHPSTPKISAGARVMMAKAAPRNNRKSSATMAAAPKSSRK